VYSNPKDAISGFDLGLSQIVDLPADEWQLAEA